MHKYLIFCLGVLALAGCGQREPIRSTERLTVIDGSTGLPVPIRSDLVAPDRPSLIGPLDTLRVEVFGIPELGREVQVDSSGHIAIPMIGSVDAGGRTTEELATEIEAALARKYVRNPSVTVNIKSSVSQVVTVDGEVRDPGLYPVTNQMTLMRAIASARGLTEFARLQDVVILRTVNGQRLAGLYNLGEIRRGSYDDPDIYANDIVLVGDSPARRLFRDIISLAPAVAAPIVALIQNN